MEQPRNEAVPGVARRWVWLRRPAWIFIVAFILRAGIMATLMAHNPLSWRANEPSSIASAMVQGHGFSSAFHDTTEPTAWLAPVYPTLLACIFRFLGVKTAASAVAAVLLNIIFSSFTAVVLVHLGREQLNEVAGVVAGWAWAISPPLLFMPWLLWETCLSGLVLVVVFRKTLLLSNSSRFIEWASCGIIWSFAALLNPALLSPLPLLAIDAAWRNRRWKQSGLLLLVCILGVLPWTARNYLAFGRIVPIRSNFWPEAYFGNVGFYLHPTGDSMLYQQEGELAFAGDMKQRVLTFVRSHPATFVRLSWRRLISFWTLPPQLHPYPLLLLLTTVGGTIQAWRRRKPWFGFGSVLVVYPIVYYLTYTFARYRYPIEPLMYVLSAFCMCEAVLRLGESQKVPSAQTPG
jgi:hypothetical protein